MPLKHHDFTAIWHQIGAKGHAAPIPCGAPFKAHLDFAKLPLILQPQLAGVGFAMMADAARGAKMVQTTRAWARELEQLHGRIAHRFRRAEPRRRSLAYLKGLAASVERKNGWQMAEAVGDSTPDGVQRLLNQAEWDTDLVRDDLREYVVEHFADERAVLVVDERPA